MTAPYHPPHDAWMCMSHDDFRPMPCVIVMQDIQKLINASGGWDELCIDIWEKHPKKKLLAAMRELMGVMPFEKDAPFITPEQPWIAKCAKEFVEWYIEHHGEPKNKSVSKEPEKVGV